MESIYRLTESESSGTHLAVAMLSSDAVQLGMSGRNAWYLDIIRTYPHAQEQGWGSKLLAHIVLEADREIATLYLSVDPIMSGSLTHRQLRAWYRRFGFTSHRPMTEINYMRRYPRGEADDGSLEVQHAYQRHEGCPLCRSRD